MRDFFSIPNEISHKELNSLFRIACKEHANFASTSAKQSSEKEEFKALIDEWTEITKQILPLLQDENREILKDLSPREAMATGVFQVHLSLSLQAKSAFQAD